MIDLTGRTALVTGAGQGVGRAIALQMTKQGADAIAVVDYREERAQAVAAEIDAMGGRGLAVQNDVSSFDGVQQTVDHVRSRLGSIDILVNNAGNAGPNPTRAMDSLFWEQTPTEWQGYLGTNLYGVLNYCHAVIPGMIQSNWGRIINLISDAGRFGEPNREVYSAAKAGVGGFTRSVAASLGRYSVTANCVSISATDTPRTHDALQDEERLKKMMSHYIIRRPGDPSDPANMVTFLASDAAPWVTGQTIPVNGGYSFAL